MNIWKSILAHNWTDQSIDAAILYLSTGKMPDNYTTDMKNSFKKRLNMGYAVKDDKTLVFRTIEKPIWLAHVLQLNDELFEFKVVRPSEINKILTTFFKDESTTAMNYRTLYDKVVRAMYLGISRTDVHKYLKNNPVHLRMTDVNPKPYVQSFRPSYPFEYWQMDLIDFRKLSDENNNYNYILVIIDIFSKFVYLFPIRGGSGMMKEICNCLKKLFLSGDIPKKLGCDNQFDTKEVNSLCEIYHIKVIYGLPYHPQTQGFVENKNKQIKGFVYLHFNKHQTLQYYDILDYITFSINNTKHAVTRKTPNEIHRGRVLPIPRTDIEVNSVPTEFDLAFPTLTEYNKSQILESHTQKETEINIDSLNYNESEVETYDTHAQNVYSQNVNNIKRQLHHEAKKREMKYNQKQRTKFAVNNTIKLRTYIDHGGEIQGVQLRLKSKEKDESYVILKNPLYRYALTDPAIETQERRKIYIVDIKKYPKTAFSKAALSMSFDWKIKDSNENTSSVNVLKFRIVEIIQNEKSGKRYHINTLDNQYIVEYLTHKETETGKEERYSREFPHYMLHNIQYSDVNENNISRPSYSFTPVSLIGETQTNVTQMMKQTHEEELKELRKTLAQQKKDEKKKEKLLELDHHIGSPDLTLEEIEKTKQQKDTWFNGLYMYVNTNFIEENDGIILIKIDNVKYNHGKSTLMNVVATWQYVNPYTKKYDVMKVHPILFSKKSKAKENVFKQGKFKYEIDFQNYTYEERIEDNKWVFAHPNKIREKLKLDYLVDENGKKVMFK